MKLAHEMRPNLGIPPTNLPCTINELRLIGSTEVATALNFSAAHIRRLVHANKFPKPIIIGGRKLAWRIGDIVQFLQNQTINQ